MRETDLNGLNLAIREAGKGSPVVFIHGALIADAFRPLFTEPALVDACHLIAYSRRGYSGSSAAPNPFSVQAQAADCLALLAHLGLDQAHFVGHSFGGAVALQLALDAPERVRSLALLEPALMVGDSAEGYRASLEAGVQQYSTRPAAEVVDAMLGARWPGYLQGLERIMPGAHDQAVADSAATFETELPALLQWTFGAAEAASIHVPLLSVIGERSPGLSPRFDEVHRWILATFRHAEPYVLPRAHHFLQIENPADMAAALSAFFARHPI